MNVEICGIYKHFKGNIYVVLGVALDTVTEKNVVIYQGLYGNNPIFTRPYEEFVSKVPSDRKNPTGQVYRFEKLER